MMVRKGLPPGTAANLDISEIAMEWMMSTVPTSAPAPLVDLSMACMSIHCNICTGQVTNRPTVICSKSSSICVAAVFCDDGVKRPLVNHSQHGTVKTDT